MYNKKEKNFKGKNFILGGNVLQKDIRTKRFKQFITTTIFFVLLFSIPIFVLTKEVETLKRTNEEIIKENELKVENLERTIQETQKTIESYEKEVSKIKEENQKLKTENKEISDENANLENTIKSLCSTGTKPQNYRLPETVSCGSFVENRGKLEYVGVWTGTFYTPSADECSNNKGITASGRPVQPGKTIAVDPKYWKLGTRFYIEGIGEVVADDTGSKVKGRNRFDLCILDKETALKVGVVKRKVYLIKDGDDVIKRYIESQGK